MQLLMASLADLEHLARGLAAREFQITALQPRSVDLGEFRRFRVSEGGDLPYDVRVSPVFPRRPYPYSLYRANLPRLLRLADPDLVYIVSEPSELGAAQLARAVRNWSASLPIAMWSFENVDRNWRGFPRCLRGRAERETLRRADLMIVSSQGTVHRLQRLGFPAERIRQVYHGVSDVALYEQAQGPLNPEARWAAPLEAQDTFRVGYVGRLVPEKGVDVLLQALALLPPTFMLQIAGAGRSEPELRALSERLRLSDRVQWLGTISREQLPAHMASLDALVLPSRSIPQWQEQFGIVLAEAMLLGTPVVGSSSGAIPEVIGEAGLVFPEGDAAALAAALQRLQADPALQRQLGLAGSHRARERFAPHVYYDGVAAALRELAALGVRR